MAKRVLLMARREWERAKWKGEVEVEIIPAFALFLLHFPSNISLSLSLVLTRFSPFLSLSLFLSLYTTTHSLSHFLSLYRSLNQQPSEMDLNWADETGLQA